MNQAGIAQLSVFGALDGPMDGNPTSAWQPKRYGSFLYGESTYCEDVGSAVRFCVCCRGLVREVVRGSFGGRGSRKVIVRPAGAINDPKLELPVP